VVLGVGMRAKRIDDAEADWVDVLLDGGVSLGRVDENLGPIGYRTLLVWKLKEALGHPGLVEQLRSKSEKVVDHVLHLAVLLKAGDLDYGFLYRSTCVAHDIRFVPLEETINLGGSGRDYGSARLTIGTPGQDDEPAMAIAGSPITYSLAIPVSATHPQQASALIHYLLGRNRGGPDAQGYRFFPPRFYGARDHYTSFRTLATYAGPF